MTRDTAREAKRLLGLPIHLQLAAAGLSFDRAERTWIDQWIATAMLAADPATSFGATLGVTTGALGLEVSGERTRVLPCLRQFFADCAIDAAERDRVEAELEALAPARLGYATEIRGTEVSGRWFAPIEMPLDRALALAPSTPSTKTLAQWAIETGAGPSTRIGRALGGGNAFTEIAFSISGPIERSLVLFRALDVAEPTPALVAAVVAASRAGAPLEIIAWLTATGVSRLGLLIPGGDVDVVRALHRAIAGAPVGLAVIATFEGSLGVARARTLELGTLGREPLIALHYTPGMP